VVVADAVDDRIKIMEEKVKRRERWVMLLEMACFRGNETENPTWKRRTQIMKGLNLFIVKLYSQVRFIQFY